MQLRFTLIAVCACLSIGLHAQELAGKKMLSTTMYATRWGNTAKSTPPILNVDRTSETVFEGSIELLYGKVSKKNLLFAYGLQGSTTTRRGFTNGQQTSKYKESSLYPTVLLQKYYAITDRIWFSPVTRLKARYKNKDDFATYEAIAELNPLGFTFAIGKRLQMQLAAGNVRLSNTYRKFKGNSIETTQNNFSVNAGMMYWATGIQMIL